MNFLKIADGIDTAPVLAELDAHPELWGQIPYRGEGEGSPHAEMRDIFVRFNPLLLADPDHDKRSLNNPHIAEWFPAARCVPSLRPLLFGLMAAVQGEALGMVLLTRLPPGGKIKPHVDGGWHAEFYDKFYIPLRNEPGAAFCWADGQIDEGTGGAWWFRNDVTHWVNNDSPSEKIGAIVCIRTDMFRRP